MASSSSGRTAPTKAKLKVKKGDTVQVIAGKDKGAKGKIIQVYPETQRVLVEGVNRIKKHTRVSTTQRGAKTGGIVTQEAAIHVSNVMVVAGGKATRVGSRVDETTREDGRVERKRVRVSKRTGEEI
jgi:large subunit ribosomal protein L24